MSPLQHWRNRMLQRDVGDPIASAICLDAPFFSSPLGKPHLSSLGYVSASLRYSWRCSHKLLLILSLVMKLRIIIASPHFRHYAVNQTLLQTALLRKQSKILQKSMGSCNFYVLPKQLLSSIFSPLLITAVSLTVEAFYIANVL